MALSTEVTFLRRAARDLEGNVGDALDLRHRIDHGVESGARGAFAGKSAGLAEVDSSEQLAHEENIGALEHLRDAAANNRPARRRRSRAKIGKAAEGFADGQQTGFRLLGRRQRVELRPANGAQQHGVGCETLFQRLLRQRRAELLDGDSADGQFLELNVELAFD